MLLYSSVDVYCSEKGKNTIQYLIKHWHNNYLISPKLGTETMYKKRTKAIRKINRHIDKGDRLLQNIGFLRNQIV